MAVGAVTPQTVAKLLSVSTLGLWKESGTKRALLQPYVVVWRFVVDLRSFQSTIFSLVSPLLARDQAVNLRKIAAVSVAILFDGRDCDITC